MIESIYHMLFNTTNAMLIIMSVALDTATRTHAAPVARIEDMSSASTICGIWRRQMEIQQVHKRLCVHMEMDWWWIVLDFCARGQTHVTHMYAVYCQRIGRLANERFVRVHQPKRIREPW